MANWTDNLLTVSGSAASLDQLLQDMNGENGLVHFSRHLPTAPVDEDGRELSWWLANADDAAIIDRQSEKVVVYLKSAWEPPVEWAEALHRKNPAFACRSCSRRRRRRVSSASGSPTRTGRTRTC
jgi:hypothetical protein